MAEALTLLRQFIKEKKSVELKDDQFTFGDVKFPRDTKTGYKSRSKATAEYTLDAVWFLLQNANLSHKDYIKECQTHRFPLISFVDRKDLLAYLTGEQDTSQLVADKTDEQKKKRKLEEETEQKKKRLQVIGEIKEVQMDESLEEAKKTLGEILESKREIVLEVGADVQYPMIKAEGAHTAYLDAEQPVSAYIQSRERNGRTRVTTLQVPKHKGFDTILRAFDQVWRAEKAPEKPQEPAKKAPTRNRYNVPESQVWKDRFNREDMDLLQNIDTSQSFFKDTQRMSQQQKSQSKPASTGPSPAPAEVSRGPPIIVLPAAPTVPVNLYNVEDFLQNGKWVPVQEKRKVNPRKPISVTINRKRRDGTNVEFLCVDDVTKLKSGDWDRVCAVITGGKAWEFKNFRTDKPVDVFTHHRGFFFMFEGETVPQTVKEWKTYTLKISKTRRHTDGSNLHHFWQELERFLSHQKKFTNVFGAR